MVSYIYQMPSGIPGNITRPEQSTVEQQILDQTTPPLSFGVPVKMVAAKIQPIATGDAAAAVYGVIVRDYPTSGNGVDGLGVASPNKAFPASILKRGYINILLGGTALASSFGKVYVRTANAATGKPIGGFEAANDASIAAGVINGTGSGTIVAAITDQSQIVTGEYTLTLQSTSATSKVTVIDPNGQRLPDATVGTAYNQNGLSFTITSGGTMTRGDFFQPIVTSNTIVLSTRSYFTGPADASGNAEIAFNI